MMAILAQTGAVKADEADVDAVVAVLEWGNRYDPRDGRIATYLVVKALCTFFAMH